MRTWQAKGIFLATATLALLLAGCRKQPEQGALPCPEAIFPKGDRGSADYFTGTVYTYGLVAADSVYTTLVGNVFFEPGARTYWHTHPGGQILVITGGVGYHQIEGEPIRVMRKGEVVKCPPDVRHWHGASPDKGLQQLYIVPHAGEGIVAWMEPVTDDQYRKP